MTIMNFSLNFGVVFPFFGDVSFHSILTEGSVRWYTSLKWGMNLKEGWHFFFCYDRHSLERWAQNKNSAAVRKVLQEQEKGENKKPAKTGKQLLTLLWRPICAGRGHGERKRKHTDNLLLSTTVIVGDRVAPPLLGDLCFARWCLRDAIFVRSTFHTHTISRQTGFGAGWNRKIEKAVENYATFRRQQQQQQQNGQQKRTKPQSPGCFGHLYGSSKMTAKHNHNKANARERSGAKTVMKTILTVNRSVLVSFAENGWPKPSLTYQRTHIHTHCFNKYGPARFTSLYTINQ